MKIRQYIELAVNGCDCRECLDAIIRTAEEDSDDELATLRAENERLREALQGIVDLCDYGTHHHIIAKEALK